MNKSTLGLISIVILGFLAYACYIIITTPAEAPTPTFKHYIEPSPLVTNKDYIQVLTIDLADDRDFSQDNILYGHDAALIFYNQEGNSNTIDLNQINGTNFEILSQLEQQGKTYLDAFDPLFQHIYLLRLTAGGTRKEITSAWAGGIRAINFGTQAALSAKQPGKLANIAGTATLSDGSTRKIEIVPVASAYLLTNNSIGANSIDNNPDNNTTNNSMQP